MENVSYKKTTGLLDSMEVGDSINTVDIITEYWGVFNIFTRYNWYNHFQLYKKNNRHKKFVTKNKILTLIEISEKNEQ